MTDTLIQRLRRHRGDYVEEMDEAADALEQQAADLAYVKAASVFNLMEENKRQAAQIEALRADAERYRWLRRTTNAVTSKGERIDVRNNPDLWDAAIDAALRQEGRKEKAHDDRAHVSLQHLPVGEWKK